MLTDVRSAVAATAGVVVALSLLLIGPTAVQPSAQADDPPVRVLLVGDSVTNGDSGDWTWRYRLWQHFGRVGADVDLVGPYEGVGDPATGTQTLDYVDPDFDRDHAARGGSRFEMPDVPVDRLMVDHRPDVVVEVLGVNDLVFGGATPARLAQRARAFVAEVRAIDPRVDLVLAEVPQRLNEFFEEAIVEYNALLADVVEELDSPDSRVVLASFGEGFRNPEDVWDLAHPNASGEMLVAGGVADALAALGIGEPHVRPLPQVPVGPRLMPTLRGEADDGEIRLAWERWRGATGQLVWLRDRTAGTGWQEQPGVAPNPTTVLGGLRNGHAYEVRLRPVKGYWPAESGLYSNVVRLVPRPPGPRSAPRLRLDGRQRLRVRWAAVEGARRYQVRAERVGGGARVVRVGVRAPRARLSGLSRGRWDVTVRAVRGGVPSAPSPAARVRIARGR